MSVDMIGAVALGLYWVVAIGCCLMTWYENGRVYYVYGPPSGILTGVFWPFILLACVLIWWTDKKATTPEDGGA